MPGMLSQQQKPETKGAKPEAKRAQPDRQPRPEGQPAKGEGGKRKAPPEMQKQYNDFVGQAYNLIYDEKVLPQIQERLSAGNNPVENLATTTVMAVQRVLDSAEKAGKQFDNRVLLNGGAEIVNDLATLADKAGIHKYSEEEIKSASYLALDMFTAKQKQAGRLDEQGLARDAQALMQAEQSGRLDQLLPGARKVADAGKKMGGGQPQKEKANG